MNSFRFLERGIEAEIAAPGERIARRRPRSSRRRCTSTRAAGTLTSLRSKEEAHDYRYFPEPDLSPLVVTEAMLEAARAALPELPADRRERFEAELGLDAETARLLAFRDRAGRLLRARPGRRRRRGAAARQLGHQTRRGARRRRPRRRPRSSRRRWPRWWAWSTRKEVTPGAGKARCSRSSSPRAATPRRSSRPRAWARWATATSSTAIVAGGDRRQPGRGREDPRRQAEGDRRDRRPRHARDQGPRRRRRGQPDRARAARRVAARSRAWRCRTRPALRSSSTLRSSTRRSAPTISSAKQVRRQVAPDREREHQHPGLEPVRPQPRVLAAHDREHDHVLDQERDPHHPGQPVDLPDHDRDRGQRREDRRDDEDAVPAPFARGLEVVRPSVATDPSSAYHRGMSRLIRMDQTGHTTLAEWTHRGPGGRRGRRGGVPRASSTRATTPSSPPGEGHAEQVRELPVDADLVILRARSPAGSPAVSAEQVLPEVAASTGGRGSTRDAARSRRARCGRSRRSPTSCPFVAAAGDAGRAAAAGGAGRRPSRSRTRGSSPSSTPSAGPTWCARAARATTPPRTAASACSATSSATRPASCTPAPASCSSAGRLGIWLVGEAGALLVRRGGRRVYCCCVRASDPDLPVRRPHRPPAAGAARRRGGLRHGGQPGLQRRPLARAPPARAPAAPGARRRRALDRRTGQPQVLARRSDGGRCRGRQHSCHDPRHPPPASTLLLLPDAAAARAPRTDPRYRLARLQLDGRDAADRFAHLRRAVRLAAGRSVPFRAWRARPATSHSHAARRCS